MSFRPFTDVWLLARPKTKYFGAYPSGFLLRARDLLNAGYNDQVVHICSGRVLDYRCGPSCKGPTDGHRHGLGPTDVTVDLDPNLKADIQGDVRDPQVWKHIGALCPQVQAFLADPPYNPEFAAHYNVGAAVLPSPDSIVKHAIGILPVGGRVGILGMGWPRYPQNARQIAIVGVLVGNGNIGRWYAVYERTA